MTELEKYTQDVYNDNWGAAVVDHVEVEITTDPRDNPDQTIVEQAQILYCEYMAMTGRMEE